MVSVSMGGAQFMRGSGEAKAAAAVSSGDGGGGGLFSSVLQYSAQRPSLADLSVISFPSKPLMGADVDGPFDFIHSLNAFKRIVRSALLDGELGCVSNAVGTRLSIAAALHCARSSAPCTYQGR